MLVRLTQTLWLDPLEVISVESAESSDGTALDVSIKTKSGDTYDVYVRGATLDEATKVVEEWVDGVLIQPINFLEGRFEPNE